MNTKHIVVTMPLGTEAYVTLGETLFSTWQPSAPITLEDVKQAEKNLMSAGLGDATAQAIAARWSRNWPEFSPLKMPRGRQKPFRTASWYEGKGQVY